MELHLPPKKKRIFPQINWTEEMIAILKEKFPSMFNKELAKLLGVSWRTFIRKARELGIEKEENFLETRREIITAMAVKNNHNPFTGKKGWSVPGGEKYRFQKGIESCMKIPTIKEKAIASRKETVKSERIRIRYGLPQRTKLKLKA